MAVADNRSYLRPVVDVLKTHWPANRAINVVCHGHSVPAGYFATPRVDAANAYPRLLHDALLERYPFAVVNVIVTAIGGENSPSGAARFAREVLCHRPDVLAIDYGLNDRGAGLEAARTAWTAMVDQALAQGAKVLLLTPTSDMTQAREAPAEHREPLRQHAQQIRELAVTKGVGLVDSLAAFEAHSGDLTDLLSWSNHPNRTGHELVARELLRWFPPS
jgi:lysophospholipase L1-like esterase